MTDVILKIMLVLHVTGYIQQILYNSEAIEMGFKDVYVVDASCMAGTVARESCRVGTVLSVFKLKIHL